MLNRLSKQPLFTLVLRALQDVYATDLYVYVLQCITGLLKQLEEISIHIGKNMFIIT